MFYRKDNWAADVLLGQRPSLKKRTPPEAVQRKTDRLLWALFAIEANYKAFRVIFLPILARDGRKKSKLRSAILHIRCHYTAKMMVLVRIEADLVFLRNIT